MVLSWQFPRHSTTYRLLLINADDFSRHRDGVADYQER